MKKTQNARAFLRKRPAAGRPAEKVGGMEYRKTDPCETPADEICAPSDVPQSRVWRGRDREEGADDTARVSPKVGPRGKAGHQAGKTQIFCVSRETPADETRTPTDQGQSPARRGKAKERRGNASGRACTPFGEPQGKTRRGRKQGKRAAACKSPQKSPNAPRNTTQRVFHVKHRDFLPDEHKTGERTTSGPDLTENSPKSRGRPQRGVFHVKHKGRWVAAREKPQKEARTAREMLHPTTQPPQTPITQTPPRLLAQTRQAPDRSSLARDGQKMRDPTSGSRKRSSDDQTGMFHVKQR